MCAQTVGFLYSKSYSPLPSFTSALPLATKFRGVGRGGKAERQPALALVLDFGRL